MSLKRSKKILLSILQMEKLSQVLRTQMKPGLEFRIIWRQGLLLSTDSDSWVNYIMTILPFVSLCLHLIISHLVPRA